MKEKIFFYQSERVSVHHTRDDTPSNVDVKLHAHRSYELYYFISGSGRYTIEGNEYPLEPGCLLVMREGEAHTVHLYGDTPYERICVNFTPESMPLLDAEIRELYRSRPLGRGNHFKPSERSALFISACMERLCQDGESEDYEERARVILSMLLLELYKLSEQRPRAEENGPERMAVEMRGSAETVRKIIGYINENLTTIKNSDALAHEFFFSKAYINRIFKQATGSSVWDYVVLKRLLLARSMLREGKPACIAASECGFCDYSSFYRQYRRRFGSSPQEARKLTSAKKNN